MPSSEVKNLEEAIKVLNLKDEINSRQRNVAINSLYDLIRNLSTKEAEKCLMRKHFIDTIEDLIIEENNAVRDSIIDWLIFMINLIKSEDIVAAYARCIDAGLLINRPQSYRKLMRLLDSMCNIYPMFDYITRISQLIEIKYTREYLSSIIVSLLMKRETRDELIEWKIRDICYVLQIARQIKQQSTLFDNLMKELKANKWRHNSPATIETSSQITRFIFEGISNGSIYLTNDLGPCMIILRLFSGTIPQSVVNHLQDFKLYLRLACLTESWIVSEACLIITNILEHLKDCKNENMQNVELFLERVILGICYCKNGQIDDFPSDQVIYTLKLVTSNYTHNTELIDYLFNPFYQVLLRVEEKDHFYRGDCHVIARAFKLCGLFAKYFDVVKEDQLLRIYCSFIECNLSRLKRPIGDVYDEPMVVLLSAIRGFCSYLETHQTLALDEKVFVLLKKLAKIGDSNHLIDEDNQLLREVSERVTLVIPTQEKIDNMFDSQKDAKIIKQEEEDEDKKKAAKEEEEEKK